MLHTYQYSERSMMPHRTLRSWITLFTLLACSGSFLQQANAACPFGYTVATACIQSGIPQEFDGHQNCDCLNFVTSDLCPAAIAESVLDNCAAACDAVPVKAPGTVEHLIRLTAPDYADQISAPAGADRLSARAISNIVASFSGPESNVKNASDWVWLWGQFVTHDMDLSVTNTSEPLPIHVPCHDPVFDPKGFCNATLPFSRSNYFASTGTSITNPRQQMSIIPPLLDASQVYGQNIGRQTCIRLLDGSGGLLYSAGEMLPFNMNALPNGQDPLARPPAALYCAGDVRANEHVSLSAVHALFLREHNRIAQNIKLDYPQYNDTQIFDKSKFVVIAELQRMTWEEYLPIILGDHAFPPYTGFSSSTSPLVSMEFAQVCFRLHTMISNSIVLVDNSDRVVVELPMHESYFNVTFLEKYGVHTLYKGLASKACKGSDIFMVDGLRNMLFNVLAGGFDLFAVDIQRGRDHGITNYNAARVALGLSKKNSFSEISSDSEVVSRLSQAYSSVDDIDMIVGMLAEDRYLDALVGELAFTVLVEQFTRTRNADPNFYLLTANDPFVKKYGLKTLSAVIKANSIITNIQDNAFIAP